MTYVSLVIGAFLLVMFVLMLRARSRMRALMKRQDESLERQRYQLPRIEQLGKLFEKRTRPVAEFEDDARVLIAELRASDVDGAIAPVIEHFESELARRR